MHRIQPQKIWIRPQRKLFVNCKHQALVVKMDTMTGYRKKTEERVRAVCPQ